MIFNSSIIFFSLLLVRDPGMRGVAHIFNEVQQESRPLLGGVGGMPPVSALFVGNQNTSGSFGPTG
jgi:hypothetical protein